MKHLRTCHLLLCVITLLNIHSTFPSQLKLSEAVHAGSLEQVQKAFFDSNDTQLIHPAAKTHDAVINNYWDYLIESESPDIGRIIDFFCERGADPHKPIKNFRDDKLHLNRREQIKWMFMYAHPCRLYGCSITEDMGKSLFYEGALTPLQLLCVSKSNHFSHKLDALVRRGVSLTDDRNNIPIKNMQAGIDERFWEINSKSATPFLLLISNGSSKNVQAFLDRVDPKEHGAIVNTCTTFSHRWGSCRTPLFIDPLAIALQRRSSNSAIVHTLLESKATITTNHLDIVARNDGATAASIAFWQQYIQQIGKYDYIESRYRQKWEKIISDYEQSEQKKSADAKQKKLDEQAREKLAREVQDYTECVRLVSAFNVAGVRACASRIQPKGKPLADIGSSGNLVEFAHTVSAPHQENHGVGWCCSAPQPIDYESRRTQMIEILQDASQSQQPEHKGQ